jgi:putative tryptophan/tyrosine transport system substrate-binding protein
MFDVKRREFISLFGGTAAAWPLAARAQQTAVPVIGLLNHASPDGNTERLRGFRQGLKETGFIEGENVVIEYRWAENHVDRLPELAADLVRRRVAVIAATGGNHVIYRAKAATTTIPIVFIAGDDPVKLGFVASLARPGANLTGVNFLGQELVEKRLQLTRELVPRAARVAVLVNRTDPVSFEATLRAIDSVAHSMALQVQILNASTSPEINEAFRGFLHDRPDALFVAADGFFASRRIQMVQLAARYTVPATFAFRDYVEAGGLLSYGANIVDAFRQIGVYAGRILKGAKPADLPVVQSSKFELVINAETARMLDLTVPPSLLAIADEVIE